MFTEAKFDTINTALRKVQALIQHLDNQMGQLAKATLERQQGSLASNTEAYLREQLKAITLRSGREVEMRTEKQSTTEKNSAKIKHSVEQENATEK